MSGGVPVLLATPGLPGEPALVAACQRPGIGLTVVRRCVDALDLVAAAAAGTARVAVVDAGLPRLARDTVARLAAAGVAVVGAVAPGDEPAERRLRGLGIERVAVVADPEAGARALAVAVGDCPAPAAPVVGYGDVRAAVHRATARVDDGAGDGVLEPPVAVPGAVDPPGSPGRLVVVWGPTGAPGRTSVAVALADESARRGEPTLLVDADTYGGAVATSLGLLDEASGLAVACRLADAGRLDLPALATAARSVGPDLRVLTGIGRAERWPQLRPASLEALWHTCRLFPGVTVVDAGFCLEDDEELAYDTVAPRRNAATLTALAAADVVVAVGSADPVGMARLVDGLPTVRALAPDATLRVVVTRVRPSVLGRDPAGQVREALLRHAGVRGPVLVPADPDAFDACAKSGVTLAEAAPRSPARVALARLAARVAA